MVWGFTTWIKTRSKYTFSYRQGLAYFWELSNFGEVVKIAEKADREKNTVQIWLQELLDISNICLVAMATCSLSPGYLLSSIQGVGAGTMEGRAAGVSEIVRGAALQISATSAPHSSHLQHLQPQRQLRYIEWKGVNIMIFKKIHFPPFSSFILQG